MTIPYRIFAGCTILVNLDQKDLYRRSFDLFHQGAFLIYDLRVFALLLKAITTTANRIKATAPPTM